MTIETARIAGPHKVIFISTTDALGGREQDLRRMICSVADFASSSGTKVSLNLLIQRAGADGAAMTVFPEFAHIMRHDSRMSLSAARNAIIARIQSDGGFAPDDIVLFPDDDCWYPPSVLATVRRAFEAHPDLDLWFCRYSSTPLKDAAVASAATFKDVARFASSNTVAVRGDLLIKGLHFSEDLGVGALHNGGEDTDFALSALGRSRRAQFVNTALVGHRDGAPEFAVRYYRGALLAVARNRKLRGGSLELARKLGVGLFRVCQRRMPMRDFIESLSFLFRDARQANVAENPNVAARP